MKTKHIFVPALDVGEILPFAVHRQRSLQENLKEQERAKLELIKFVNLLEKNYGRKVYYMGMDVIASKSYERFIFEDGGFLEIMIESPLALNAHFVHQDQARKFRRALAKTLQQGLPRGITSKLFIRSITVQKEQDESYLEKWDKFTKGKGRKK